jgi:hypothetical protein
VTKENVMLVATYALMTLTIEQDHERNCIYQLQHLLRKPLEDSTEFDCVALTTQFEKLSVLAESRHRQRLEDCLIPALREATNEAGFPLRALERLGQAGIAMLPRIRKMLRPTRYIGRKQMERARRKVQAYCRNLLERLACEEEQLLPFARHVLPGEAWFRIGAEFLMQDARRAARL